MKFIILLTLFITIKSITIQTNKHCSCSELQSQDCKINNYCYWNNDEEQCESYSNICEPIKDFNLCKPKLTKGICKWNIDQCEQYLSSCDEFLTEQDCICYWNLDNQCGQFTSCSNYNQNNCPLTWDCIFLDGVCKKNEYVTCSDQEPCQGNQSLTQQCALNNDGECDAYEIYGECQDYNNFKIKCLENLYCKYQDDQCVNKLCEDFTIDQCDMAFVDKTNSILCQIQQNKCIEAVSQSLNFETCHNKTHLNYKWSNQRCVECDSLEYSIILSLLSNLILLLNL